MNNEISDKTNDDDSVPFNIVDTSVKIEAVEATASPEFNAIALAVTPTPEDPFDDYDDELTDEIFGTFIFFCLEHLSHPKQWS